MHGKTVSLTDNDNPKLYDLTLLSSIGVFQKYLVNDFTVSNEAVRYYNILSIYREWVNGIDSKTENDNIVNTKCFSVGKLYKAETVNGSVEYSCKNVDVVEIKNPYVDFLKYYDGLSFGSILGFEPDKFTDVHYIAFSTDRNIDTLKEADVSYLTQSYKEAAFNKGTTYGEKSEPQYITLTGEKTVNSSKYSWKCIQRTLDFIKSTGLDKDNIAYDNIKNNEFVLVFLTTPFTQEQKYSFMQGHSYEYNGTKVSDVKILRLMFETDGITYNLGTILDGIEADDIPGNAVIVKPIGFWAYIWRCIVRLFDGTATLSEQVVAVIVLFICLILLPTVLTILSLCVPAVGALMKNILNGIITGVKYLFIGFWYIVSAPFRLIAWIVQKIRGD